jgi:glycosyltransferase involved in cell wall biosynthesis
METFFLKHSGFSRIITVDSTSVAALQKHGIAGVVYIPNGVDPEFWAQKENEPREERSGVTFLFVGRLEEQKGLRVLIEAVRKLKSEMTDFLVQFVGEGPDQLTLERLAKESGVIENLRFLGKMSQKDLRDVYQNSDVFVLPSLHEGMPLTLLEAWACALPVIVTNAGNIPEICTHRENAWIVEPGNAGQLHEAMAILGSSQELRNRLGRNGKRSICQNYSWSSISQKILQTYANLLEEKRRKSV